MTEAIQPIMIIGTQRSGSNLLRIMLNQLQEIDAPHPPHIRQIFMPLLPLYGDLENEVRFKILLDDVCRYVEANPVAWVPMNFDRSKLYKRCSRKTLVEIAKALYETKAEIKGAQFWCCKSMANVYFIPAIEKDIQPFYIHLVRDGRDVAASFKRAIVGEKHIYHLAMQWRKEQELAAHVVEQFGEKRTAVLFYEPFISDPEKALTPILQKLGLKWNNAMLNFYNSEEAKNTAAAGEMWSKVVTPVDSTNKKHYSENLSAEEIEFFERIAGRSLLQFGYALDTKPDEKPFTAEEIQSFAVENERLKKQAVKHLVHDAETRLPQQKVLAEIKSRFEVFTES